MKKKMRCFVLLSCLLVSLGNAKPVRADSSVGDAALIVAISTASGAVLGASTLPFYEKPGEHTKNIFYGAAIGAVVGVLVSAYVGFDNRGNLDDDALLAPKRPSQLALNESPEFRLQAESSSAKKGPAVFANGSALAWSQIAQFRF